MVWEIDVQFFGPKHNPSVFDVFYLHKYSHDFTEFNWLIIQVLLKASWQHYRPTPNKAICDIICVSSVHIYLFSTSYNPVQLQSMLFDTKPTILMANVITEPFSHLCGNTSEPN